MFSATAIQKLTQLSRQLVELSQKPYAPAQTSEHSAQMITSTLEIINNLISHNEVKYWKKKENAQSMKTLVDFVDNQKGIYVPNVFNQQSYDLAQILLAFSISLDAKKDLDIGWIASKLVNATVGDPKKYIQSFNQSLSARIGIYENIQAAVASSTSNAELSGLANQFFDKIEQYDFNQENKNVILEDYKNLVDAFMQKLASMPYYLRFALNSAGGTQTEPQKFGGDDINICGDRATHTHRLLAIEEHFNKTAKERSASLHTNYAHEKMNELVVAPKGKSRKFKSFKNLFNAFTRELDDYVKGTHLPFYQSVDEHKKTLADKVHAQLLEIIKAQASRENGYENIGFRLSAAVKITQDAVLENETISGEKVIGMGKLSDILHRINDGIFDLIFAIDERDDTGLHHRIAAAAEQAAALEAVPSLNNSPG